jgi:hypothetical protein
MEGGLREHIEDLEKIGEKFIQNKIHYFQCAF